MNTNQKSAREIADDILDYCEECVSMCEPYEDKLEILARAYLELETEFKLLKTYYDDLYVRADGDRITKLELDNTDLQIELDYYKEMELRYNQLLEETSNEAWLNMQNRIVELTGALNKIGILAMSELAYTSEFTEQAKAIVQGALK